MAVGNYFTHTEFDYTKKFTSRRISKIVSVKINNPDVNKRYYQITFPFALPNNVKAGMGIAIYTWDGNNNVSSPVSSWLNGHWRIRAKGTTTLQIDKQGTGETIPQVPINSQLNIFPFTLFNVESSPGAGDDEAYPETFKLSLVPFNTDIVANNKGCAKRNQIEKFLTTLWTRPDMQEFYRLSYAFQTAMGNWNAQGGPSGGYNLSRIVKSFTCYTQAWSFDQVGFFELLMDPCWRPDQVLNGYYGSWGLNFSIRNYDSDNYPSYIPWWAGNDRFFDTEYATRAAAWLMLDQMTKLIKPFYALSSAEGVERVYIVNGIPTTINLYNACFNGNTTIRTEC